jgi:hypothetical protein
MSSVVLGERNGQIEVRDNLNQPNRLFTHAEAGFTQENSLYLKIILI